MSTTPPSNNAGPTTSPTPTACPLRLDISGMHCAACSARIEKVVGRIRGVARIAVNLATARAEITLTPNAADSLTTDIMERIAMLGFQATPAPDDDPRSTWEASRRKDAAALQAQQARLWSLFAVTVPLMILAMAHMLGLPLPSALHPAHTPASFALTQLALTLPALWLGRHFYVDGVQALLRRSPTMDSLVATGTGTAFLYSLWQTGRIVLAVWSPNTLGLSLQEGLTLGTAASMDLYFESVAMLLCMISLGQYLEHRSRRTASDALGALMSLVPDQVLLWRDGATEKIAVEHVRPGDLILLRPGARIPVDGSVHEGCSAVDCSLLTGEAMPVPVNIGDKLVAGSLNTTGALTMRAEQVGGDTQLARIMRLVRDAQSGKAPIARLADTISAWFTPCIIGLATLAALCWLTLGGESLAVALRIFVAVLVIACPCAMGLATPMSIMVATGRGAQQGVLIRNGAALENTGKITVLAIDKTGTLTTGSPTLTEIIKLAGRATTLDNKENSLHNSGIHEKTHNKKAQDSALNSIQDASQQDTVVAHANGSELQFSSADLLRLAASLEAKSEHPLAQALLAAAAGRGLTLSPATEVRITPGMGICGLVEGRQIVLGNAALLQEQKIPLPASLLQQCDTLADAGRTPLLLAVDEAPCAIFGIADTLRPESASVVAKLRTLGIRVLMLSGDNERAAHAVAKEAGISEVIAGILPQDKARIIRELQQQGHIVGMAGDGINDAPALAQAHVGFAVGSGVDVSIEVGDIVLMRHGMEALLTALSLSRATMRNIRQNLGWAFGYNVLGLPVAAGILHLFGGPTLSPMLAGTAMAFSSVSVVLNALRLRRIPL